MLVEYEGAIVVVSHDRYLLGRLCDRVLWIERGDWGLLDGGYEAYETAQRDRERPARERERQDREPKAKSSKLTPLKHRSNLETNVTRIEREIARIDARRAQIESLFADPTTYGDRERVKALQEEARRLEESSACAVVEWERLLEELERLART